MPVDRRRVTPILVFPGQSSRSRSMWEWPLSAAPKTAGRVIAQASEILCRDLRAHFSAQGPDPFASNRDVQIGVFLANHLHLRLLEDAGLLVADSLGLSLGEYNHLVHIGALAFEDALRLVDARGAVYDHGPPGAMAAVFPTPYDELLSVVERAREKGVLDFAIYNSPTQHVLAGERAALDEAVAILEDEHFVIARVIEERLPVHSTAFAPVAAAFRPYLESAPFRAPKAPYFPNVLGHPVLQPSRDDFSRLLERHVTEPVLWRQSIERILTAAEGEVVFVEVGPGSVLTDLVRRWWPGLTLRTDTAETFERAVAFLRAAAAGNEPSTWAAAPGAEEGPPCP